MQTMDEFDNLMNGGTSKGGTQISKPNKPSLIPPSSTGAANLGGYERHRLNHVGLKATGYAAK